MSAPRAGNSVCRMDLAGERKGCRCIKRPTMSRKLKERTGGNGWSDLGAGERNVLEGMVDYTGGRGKAEGRR